ncbi:hypothetical protein Rhopal_005719-T1 [Rhodotorula paludigena]|uniref:Uncharacterized protein n=1 Tax=Rhodotorula paludigena TaxID=86838 RepID=A0AAV5GRW1_9BASI|nr:hypothetical protein Rhopal_005719-T1 [Rhodotorula paludigena]
MSASSPTWLVPPERTSLKDDVVLPFLRGLEHQLQDPSLPLLVASADPRGRVHVRAAGCAAVTTVSMITTLFPLSLAHPARTAAAGGGLGSAKPPQDGSTPLAARFPACARLVEAVEGTPGVAEWLESGERKERWSLWPSYAPDEVRRQAEQWDRE